MRAILFVAIASTVILNGAALAFDLQLQPGDIQGDITPTDQSPQKSPALQPSIRLGLGNSWYSPTGAFRLTLQASDGNVVLQALDDSTLPYGWWQQGQQLSPAALTWVPIWATGTNNKSVTEADMQVDGNFVVYSGPTAVFATNTNGCQNAFLRIQDDGNAVIYFNWPNIGVLPVWASGTNAGGKNQGAGILQNCSAQ
jgi:hypothetical protein